MKIENVRVYGLEESIVASGYPMRTKPFDDEDFDFECSIDGITPHINRAIKLAQTPNGSGHGNFLKGIIVQFDLTFSNKAWVELQRYNFIDFVSSMSTMHCVSKFDIKEMMNDYVLDDVIRMVNKLKKQYEENPTPENYLTLLYNLPSGFQLTARMTTNYLQLQTIYQQRKGHRLKPDWGGFCDWIETLPMAKELIIKKIKGEE